MILYFCHFVRRTRVLLDLCDFATCHSCDALFLFRILVLVVICDFCDVRVCEYFWTLDVFTLQNVVICDFCDFAILAMYSYSHFDELVFSLGLPFPLSSNGKVV